ncbi:MAG TPA: putative ABC transporter permease [Candidatus Onthomonas avicola]|nr:putative ABC transporter permease [Candidatus Onthomonas avicola]
MNEPCLLGIPLSELFLYFLWYSFLGWGMETIYCSAKARRLVRRGFLTGPLCPIYGVGMLLIVLFFTPLLDRPVLFYLTACVVMSAWEYFVGWLLETTTHMRYWDYSRVPLNLHGRICLPISLWWGVIAYLAIAYIHPVTEAWMARLQPPLRWWLAGVLALLVLADTGYTVQRLALTTRFLTLAEQARDELAARQRELQLAGRQKAEQARLQAALAALELRHSDLVARAAHYSKRFRRRYQHIRSARYRDTLARIREEAMRLYRERTDGQNK